MTNKIKVYSTPQCPYCKLAKEYLTRLGEKYEDINVAIDHNAAHEMIEKSGQLTVPVIEINRSIVIGFDTEKIDELLK